MHDLSSDNSWNWFHHDVSTGRLMAIWVHTPSGTFSPPHGQGPRPFRTTSSIYGLKVPHTSPRNAEKAQQETYFALQAARLLSQAHAQNIPWGFINPDPSGNPVSVFNLPEFQSLSALTGVVASDFDLCTLGAPLARPTRILSFGLDLSRCHGRCQHQPTMWDFRDKHGNFKRARATHMPFQGLEEDKAYGYPSGFLGILADAFEGSKTRPRPPLEH